MGFWDSLFAGAISSIIIGANEEYKKAKEQNRKMAEIDKVQDDFNDFLDRVGVENDVCILNPNLIDLGSTELLRAKFYLDNIKSKIRTFISLGGNPKNILNYEKIDLYLSNLKMLIDANMIDKQDEYVCMGPRQCKFNIEFDKIFNSDKDIIIQTLEIMEFLMKEKSEIMDRMKVAQGDELADLQIVFDLILKMENVKLKLD